MPFKKIPKLFLILCFLLCCSLTACDLLPGVTSDGTPTTSSGPGSPNGTPALNTWYQAGHGVEVRYEDWKDPGGDEDTVNIVRFDPKHIKLRVAYQPSQPLLMSDWMRKENATAIINGGYFDSQNNATGLVISAGQAFGSSYNGFGGMLSVDTAGHIRLRSLSQQPYDAGEQLLQATQSSPMLILPGGKRAQFDANAASSRRSVVAFDKQGRLLFISSPGGAFSLDAFADLLVQSDLAVNVALNLDGGASTGLYMNAGNQHIATDSLVELPIVIIVQAQ